MGRSEIIVFSSHMAWSQPNSGLKYSGFTQKKPVHSIYKALVKGDGEIVLSGWNQSGTLSCGLWWEVEESSDLVLEPHGRSEDIFLFPHSLGTQLYC